MLTLADVSKRFGSTQALHPTTLTMAAGETTVLIGPSGCGKSTVLRLLIGLLRPDSGTVCFDGTTLGRDNVRALRQRMGYVIQEGGLFPHLTARGNAALLGRHVGWDDDRVAARIAELTELVQLPADRLSAFPAQLSGGQRQRVSLMRALMLDPDVLLLDEPLGALDPMIRAELQDDLRRIFRSLGKTVVMVTHDMHEAAYFGDTIVLMREGRVVQAGPLDELLEAPADPFVGEFVRAQRSLHDALGTSAATAKDSRR